MLGFRKVNKDRIEIFKNSGIKFKIGKEHLRYKGGLPYLRRGHDWKIIRKEVLIKYDFKCLHCGKETKLHIHHIIPFRIVNEHKLENLIPLCTSCHMKEEWRTNRI